MTTPLPQAPPGTPGSASGPPAPVAEPPGSEPPFPSAARLGAHPAFRVLAVGTGALIALLFVGFGAYIVASLMVSTTRTGETTLTGEVRRVEAHVRGSLTVRAGADGEVRMSRRSTFGFVEPKVEVRLDEATGTAVVRVTCRGLTIECGNQVTLVVPPGVDVDVSADGSTTIEDIQGAVNARSEGGTVNLRGIGGTIDVRVGGGAILGRDLASPEVRASAGAGAIELAFLQPPDLVDTQAGAGRVLVQLPPGETTYRVEVDTGAGDHRVGVRTSADSERLIRARAGAGDVEVAYTPT